MTLFGEMGSLTRSSIKMRSLAWAISNMTGALIKRGNLDTGTDIHKEKTM